MVARLKFSQALKRADDTRCFAYSQLQSGAASRKAGFVTVYTAIAFEYHKAICTLVESALPTAALALERSLIDASEKALWIWYCADDDVMDKIVQDNAEAFPPHADLVAQYEERMGVPSDRSETKTFYSLLCGANHSGAVQLLNYTDDRGLMGRTFDIGQMIILLRSITA